MTKKTQTSVGKKAANTKKTPAKKAAKKAAKSKRPVLGFSGLVGL